MTDANKYSDRADAVADTLRTFLIAVHTGGLGILFAVAASLAAECVNPRWAVCPALIFSFGLVIAGASLLLAKHKALKRRDAARKGHAIPDFDGFLVRNFTWDAFSLLVFAAGVIVSLCRLSQVVVGCS